MFFSSCEIGSLIKGCLSQQIDPAMGGSISLYLCNREESLMNESQNSSAVNRAKPYQLVLFPLNNGATNVYYVLVLSYIATFV